MKTHRLLVSVNIGVFTNTLLIILASVSIWASPLKLYVSTDGSDKLNGMGSSTKSGSIGPLATVEAARDKLRALKSSGKLADGAIVCLRKGNYLLDRTLTFSWEDSGGESKPIIYTSYPGERATIGGGKRITGWKALTNGMWEAPLPDIDGKPWIFRELFINGEPQNRSRFPNTDDWRTWPLTVKGYPHDDNHDPAKMVEVFYPKDSIIRNWSNIQDVEINILASWRWVNAIVPLKSVDETNRVAVLSAPAAYHINQNDPFRVENVVDAIDQPGEWCVNTLERKVTILPPVGVDMNKAEVIAPVIGDLINIHGTDEDKKLGKGLVFRNLTFSQAQNGFVMSNVRGCRIEDCRIVGLGGTAIGVTQYAQRNIFAGNKITQCGGRGISITGYYAGTKDVSHHNAILNNEISHCGRRLWQSSGIWLDGSGCNVIKRNYVHDVPYSGILGTGPSIVYFNMYKPTRSDKFRWDEIGDDPTTRESVKKFIHSRNNLVEENVVQQYMQNLDDGGGIYLGCVGLGNVVRGNIVCETPRKNGLSVGLYMDDETDSALLEGNTVYEVGLLTMNKGANVWQSNELYTAGKHPNTVYAKTDKAIKRTLSKVLCGSIDSLFDRKTTYPTGVSGLPAKQTVTNYADAKPRKGGVYLSDLNEISGYARGGVMKNTAYDGLSPIRIGQYQFRKGLVTHAQGYLDPQPNTCDAEVIYDLNGKRYSRLRAIIGIEPDFSGPPCGSVTHEVWVRSNSADAWKIVYDSGMVTFMDQPKPIVVDITGAGQVRLRITDGSDGQLGDVAVWGNALVE